MHKLPPRHCIGSFVGYVGLSLHHTISDYSVFASFSLHAHLYVLVVVYEDKMLWKWLYEAIVHRMDL